MSYSGIRLVLSSIAKQFVLSSSLLLLLGVFQPALAGMAVPDRTISGFVSRPATVDLSQSLNVGVLVCNSAGQSCGFQSVTIPANQTTSNMYSLNDFNETRFKLVRIDCSQCEAPLLRQGVYAAGQPGNAVGYNDFNDINSLATIIDSDFTTENINFTVPVGTVFSGQITFPQALAGFDSVQILACAGQGEDRVCMNDFADFDAGVTSQPFSVVVAPDQRNWEISIECFSCNESFYPQGFYASGQPNNVSANVSRATLLPGDTSAANLNMQFIQGVALSGTVFLPPTITALSNGNISSRICNANDFCLSDFNSFSTGENSAEFNFFIAPELFWRLEASCGSCGSTDTFPEIFYANNQPNNSFWSRDAATAFRLMEDTTGFDLTMVEGTEFSGTVFTPNSEANPLSFDYQVFVHDAQSGFGTVSERFFNQGSMSSNYTMQVPLVEELIVGVMPSVDSPNTMYLSYLPFAFHAAGAGSALSITDRAKALPVAADEGPKSNIDIGLTEGNEIQGSINTPDGEEPAKDLFVHAIVDQLSGRGVNLGGFIGRTSGGYGGYGRGGSFGFDSGTGGYLYGSPNAGLINYIPLRITGDSGAGGQRSFNLRISPDSDTSWRTYYGCLNCGGSIERYGFFKEDPSLPMGDTDPSETVTSPGEATVVSGGADYQGHHMYLTPQDPLCVAIKTAANKTALVCL